MSEIPEIPDDIRKAAAEASESMVDSMCLTYRHDYGLLPEQERQGLRLTMSQIAYHDIRPKLALAILAERERWQARTARFGGYIIVAHPEIPPHIWDGETLKPVDMSQETKFIVAL